jgi:TPR repeat protein
VTTSKWDGNGVNGVATARTGGHRYHRAPRLQPAALALGLAAIAVLLLAVALAGPPALAQTQAQTLVQASAQPSITVPPAVTAEPASQTAFPIRVGPPNAVPHNSFVRLRGLPPMAALSDGHSIAPGAWAVSLAALSDLKIMLAAGSAGRSEIVVTLVAIDGSVLAEAKSTLAVSAAQKPDKSQAQREPSAPATASILRADVEGAQRSPSPPPSGTPPPTPQDRERALRLVKKGDEQVTEGNVAAARLFYERAADAGLAQGAMALASTFDGVELARLGVRGIQADAKEARRWYERARQLGATDAAARLARLGATN